MQNAPRSDRLPLTQQLATLRDASGLSYQELATRTGLSRLTVAAAEGRADARLSSVVAIFQELGYALLPVPLAAVDAVADFIASEGRVLARAAGTDAPLSASQRAFSEARERLGPGAERAAAPDADGSGEGSL